jgi:hypothetical protein
MPPTLQILKWFGYADGMVVGAAIGLGKLAPQYQPTVDAVVAIGASVTSILGIYAHLVAGSQTVTPRSLAMAAAEKKDAAAGKGGP